MTCSAILSQFEVRLHDDVLRDLLLPDKVFKHDLSDIHCVGQYGAASTATGTAPSVQLEKISDSVIRLLITVYRSSEAASAEFGSQTNASESGQVATQTSNDEWTRAGDTQTNSAEFAAVGATQTDGSGSGVSSTQTDGCGLLANTTQTDGSGSGVNSTQTDGCGLLANTTQTDGSGSGVNSTQTDGCGLLANTTQTDGSGSHVGITQTDGCSLLTIMTQTDILGSHSVVTQTEFFSGCAVVTQTDGSEWLSTIASQTDNSLWLCTMSSQTDSSEWLRVEGTQTSSAEWQRASFTQWDSSEWLSSSGCQTEVHHMTVSATQTTESRIGQTFSSASVETTANLSSQVNVSIQATTESTDNQCQASVLLSDVPVQASVDIATHDVQTDIQDNADADSQTELSIAWRSERDTQATVETAESVVQAAVETSEMTTQVVTEVADSTVQASVDVNESVMQTDYLGLSADCQTDVSMAREADCEVQVGAETLTASSQTDLNTGESSSQTELSTWQRTDGEVQAVVELHDSQTECDFAYTIAPDTEASSSCNELTSSQNSVLNQSFDEFGTSLLPQTVADTSLPTVLEQHPTVDGSSQTDPVTIIIGDASFLVKKLKSSAVSPSRIVTSGNEIEIEVNPDIVGDSMRRAPPASTLPVCEEKENESLNQKPAVVQGVLAPGGLLVRGGPGMGPRLRLPASVAVAAAQHQQQHVVMATRTPGGLLVRHPAAGSLVATQMPPVQMPTLVRGPQPVVGGSMSCPFCALAFIDSPALYEHLSIQHTVDQKTKWRQPRGREGKTIVPQKRTSAQPAGAASGGGSSQVPPILTPIEPFNSSAAGVRYRSPVAAKSSATVPSNSAPQQQSTVSQEAGLFEDPVDVEVVKKPRGRLPKSGGTPSRGGDTDGTPPPAKRPRTANDEDGDDESSAPVVRRGRQSASADKNSSDETPKSTPGRRGGRTPRGQKK